MRALPVPPDLVAPGCRVTAVACNDAHCAAAFSLPRSRPEVVVWADDDETTSYVAPESRIVTALALPPENCATVAVGGGDDGLFAVVDGRARRLAVKCGEAPGCCACDASGAAAQPSPEGSRNAKSRPSGRPASASMRPSCPPPTTATVLPAGNPTAESSPPSRGKEVSPSLAMV